jgi:hypothetical protein
MIRLGDLKTPCAGVKILISMRYCAEIFRPARRGTIYFYSEEQRSQSIADAGVITGFGDCARTPVQLDGFKLMISVWTKNRRLSRSPFP